jgi:hypothetical protein
MVSPVFIGRLRLDGVWALNVGDFAESRIRDGYTQEEIASGIEEIDAYDRLESWTPENPRSVALFLELDIGWDDRDWSEYFQVTCVTNDLRGVHDFGHRHVIFCDEFDWPKIKQSLINILKKCERPTWDESADQLRRRFGGEYETWFGT